MKHAKKEPEKKTYLFVNQHNGDCLFVKKLSNDDFLFRISGMWNYSSFVLSKNDVNRLVDILLDDDYESEDTI